MFGKTIDYYILRTFTHSRNKATEDELNLRERYSTYTFENALNYLEKVRNIYFSGYLPVNQKKNYLDVGCGNGELSIGLSLAGAKNITGIDIIERNIGKANKMAENLPNNFRPKFILKDIHDFYKSQQFDVVIALSAMEHIHHPDSFLKILARMMKPNGRAFVSFTPFQGPMGDHMSPFFRFPIPWRGLFFSEEAIMKLRKENYRSTDPAERYEDIQGGLNQMGYENYIKYVHEAGLEFVKHICNPQLKYKSQYIPFHYISKALTSIPKVRGFFIFSEFSILKHKE